MGKARVVRPTDPVTVTRGAGDQYRYLATGAQTNGSYFMLHALVPPGAGPGPHVQTREDEGFYVLEGTVTFWVDGEEVEAGPDTFLNVPPGVAHSFRNQTDHDARMLVWFAPAGIESMFSQMHREPERRAEIAKEFGVRFVFLTGPESDSDG